MGHYPSMSLIPAVKHICCWPRMRNFLALDPTVRALHPKHRILFVSAGPRSAKKSYRPCLCGRISMLLLCRRGLALNTTIHSHLGTFMHTQVLPPFSFPPPAPKCTKMQIPPLHAERAFVFQTWHDLQGRKEVIMPFVIYLLDVLLLE